MRGGTPGRRAAVAAAVAALAAALLRPGFATSLGIDAEGLTTTTKAAAPGAQTCTIGASGDTYADGLATNSGSNFGTQSSMSVESNTFGNERSFVVFDLSSCAIPAATDVTSATLSLYLSSAPSSSRTYAVRRVTAAWGETTLTWNDQPSVAGSNTGTTSTGTASGVTLSWTVTADVQAFVSQTATNYGWRVADNSEGSLTSVRGIFSAREHGTSSQRPQLSVTYWT